MCLSSRNVPMNDIYTEVYEKLTTLQWLMRTQQMASGPFADTARGQGRVLAMLKIQPEIATKELAFLLGIRQQSLNELLNKMEKNGYVERKPSEKDKRVLIVTLTEKGKALQPGESNHKEMFDCLSKAELEQMSRFLDLLIASFEQKTDDSRFGSGQDDWMRQARDRMGDDRFEQLMRMRQRAFGQHGSRPERNGFSHEGFPGAGPRGMGGLSENRLGPERFSESYDGPVPDRDPLKK